MGCLGRRARSHGHRAAVARRIRMLTAHRAWPVGGRSICPQRRDSMAIFSHADEKSSAQAYHLASAVAGTSAIFREAPACRCLRPNRQIGAAPRQGGSTVAKGRGAQRYHILMQILQVGIILPTVRAGAIVAHRPVQCTEERRASAQETSVYRACRVQTDQRRPEREMVVPSIRMFARQRLT